MAEKSLNSFLEIHCISFAQLICCYPLISKTPVNSSSEALAVISGLRCVASCALSWHIEAQCVLALATASLSHA